MAEHSSTPDLSVEQWKPIVGYEGLYSVSSLGRIRSDVHRKPRFLNPCLRRGYPFVSLHRLKSRAHRSVHGIVAKHFLCDRPAGMQVNHKNSDRTDNRVDNLEYVTPRQNIQHALAAGSQLGQLGEGHWKARLSENDVRQIKVLFATMGDTAIAARFGVKRSTVYSIRAGNSWVHVA
jgi:hypothetical protein